MTGRFKRYVLTDEKMSRTTAYRRRKANEASEKNGNDNKKRNVATELPPKAGSTSQLSSHHNHPPIASNSVQVSTLLSTQATILSAPSLVSGPSISNSNDSDVPSFESAATAHLQENVLVKYGQEIDETAGLGEENKPVQNPVTSVSDRQQEVSVSALESEDSNCREDTVETTDSTSAAHEKNPSDRQQEVSVFTLESEDSDCGEHTAETTGSTNGGGENPFCKRNLNDQESEMHKRVCLYCTESTAGDILVMCLALGMRHNLSWAAQVDILELINTIFGKDVIPSSKYKYLKALDDKKVTSEFHIYCKLCDGYIGLRTGVKGCMFCEMCQKDVDVSDPLNYFVSLSIQPQLKRILEDDSLADLMLNYRFNRVKKTESSLEDIYDGSVYKKHSTNGGILSSKYNFSYTFFTDGCPFGKSSNKTIWPIFIQFNELPPEQRANYICLAGLYVGPKDPNLNVYLLPFVKQANRLSQIGFNWEHRGNQISSKVIPLCCVVDSVARCSVLNRQSFGAKFGCTYCYHEAESTGRGVRYVIDGTEFKSRTLESLEGDLAKAFLVCSDPDPSKRHYRGVKGPTPLLDLEYFDVVRGVPVDYMHNMLLGTARTHMELLFATEQRQYWVKQGKGRIALASLETAIDERLLKIKPPAYLPRTPRSIKNRKLWKASEWLAWLLFYCIPCLIGLLHDFQVLHLAMLSKAAFLLLQKIVSVESVNEAHELLLSYAFLFQKHFGESEMVYNIHLLNHVAEGALRYGGLWTHNAFSFEGQNRFLLQLCKSPNLLAVQVANKFLIYNSFCSIADRLLSSDGPAEFCSKLITKRVKFFTRCGDLVLVGRGKLFDNPTLEERECLTSFDLGSSGCLSYHKCIYRGVRYVCENYSKKTKQCDSYLSTDTGEIVVLKHILKFSENVVVMCVENVTLAGEIVNRPNPLNAGKKIVMKHIQETNGRGSVKCIKPDEIGEPCIFIDTGHGSYICSVPYGAHIS